MSAADAAGQIAFELGAYEGDSARWIGHRQLMDETQDERTFKFMRLRHDQDIAWYGDYYRSSKQWHGYRARGPMQSGYDLRGHRREYPHQANQWSFTCWKDNGRAYQAHGRV
jgi:hypothetical protein